jgi:hypothetical protein
MGLRTLLRPAGPLPAGVYWRRRLVVFAATVLVVVLAMVVTSTGNRAGASATRAPGGTGHRPAVAASPSAGAEPVGTPAATSPASRHPAAGPPRRPAAVPRCGRGDLSLTATTDRRSYTAGALPRFVLAVRDSGGRRCRADLASPARSFLVLSGSDRIWSSADCETAGHAVVALRPGQRLRFVATWPRSRSRPGCQPRPAVARPGTYRVTGYVGDLASAEAVFTLAGA